MAEPLSIVASGTPNPNALKFSLNRVVAEQGKTYRAGAPADAAWAQALLAIPGVIGVYGVQNFISVNKQPDADWAVIVPLAEASLRRAFETG